MPAVNEPKETYLNNKKTIINTTKANEAGIKQIPSVIPSNVATPFPPLNSANIGKICPKTAKTPTIIGYKKTSFTFGNILILWCAKKGKINPLKTSNKNTGIAALGPKTLKVLVVPAFPLPNWRISIP